MKKILLDSHVFLDYFLKSEKETEAKKIISSLLEERNQGVISVVSLLEIKYRMMKIFGHERATEAIFLIKNLANLEIINVDSNIAEAATDIRFKYYKKKECEMSYADAIHIATALISNCALIVTGDEDFKNLTEIETIIY